VDGIGGGAARREVEIAGTPEEVWDAVRDPEAWLGDAAEAPEGLVTGRDFSVEEDGVRRRGRVLLSEPPRGDRPGRLEWWWWREGEDATRVEVLVVAGGARTRVLVTEVVGPVAGGLLAAGPLAGRGPTAAACAPRLVGAVARRLPPAAACR